MTRRANRNLKRMTAPRVQVRVPLLPAEEAKRITDLGVELVPDALLELLVETAKRVQGIHPIAAAALLGAGAASDVVRTTVRTYMASVPDGDARCETLLDALGRAMTSGGAARQAKEESGAGEASGPVGEDEDIVARARRAGLVIAS